MKSVWILLLALVVLVPTAGAFTQPVQDECQEESDCGEGGSCDFDCSLCVCCGHRTQALTTSYVTTLPEDLPATREVAVQLAPVAPPPTDILHVPKSL